MADDDPVELNNLYSAVVQCFVVIFLGYLAGRSGLISSVQSAGIGSFVSKFSLPALLFKSMVELDFSQVDWMFLVSVLIAKGSLFIAVIIITLFVKRPLNLGYAGIFAIFCTQSNDFAVGYPILYALYSKSHKDYLNYLYLVAPISLVVLNPIGFTLMEIQKTRSEHNLLQGSASSGVAKAMSRVAKGVFTNPIVLMTVFGICGHFIFNGKVPYILDSILEVLGNAYNSTALFVLGLSTVGKIKGNLGISLLVPILLITAKTLILPLIIWEAVGGLVNGHNDTNCISMYGFIYGTFPAAPSVFLYANNYNLAEDIVARGIVFGTFLSAPLMFGSAKMMTMAVLDTTDHGGILGKTGFDISIVSLVACVCVIAVLVFGRKWRLIPHRFTLGLVISQIISSIGMILYYKIGMHNISDGTYYTIVTLALVGIFSSRIWTAVIALIMCLLYTRSLCYVIRRQFWFWFAGFGLPVFLTGLVFLIGSHDMKGPKDPTFHFGKAQTVVSIIVLLFSIIVTIICIVLWQRTERRHHHFTNIRSPTPNSRTTHGSFDEFNPDRTFRSSSARDNEDESRKQIRSQITKSLSIEDIVANNGDTHHIVGNLMTETVSERSCLLGQCTPEQRQECLRNLNRYMCQNVDEEELPKDFAVEDSPDPSGEYQSSHHLVLLLVLLLSMFVGLFMCSWKLNHPENSSGIHLEMQFLDIFLIYGQGIIFVAVFGFDTRLVFSPLIQRLKQWFISAEKVGLLRFSSSQNKTTKRVCSQFRQYHQDKCEKEIVKDSSEVERDFDSGLYSIGDSRVLVQKFFRGTDLCNWLIEAGLAEDTEMAIAYGSYLLKGKVIAHAHGRNAFQNTHNLYKFVDEEEDC